MHAEARRSMLRAWYPPPRACAWSRSAPAYSSVSPAPTRRSEHLLRCTNRSSRRAAQWTHSGGAMRLRSRT
ncbi:hypothetical protein B0H12DRAFT_1121652 [Mycena haematopus]|nr:hypothetical protein B0H12DRAFT_1121652 [Mycena haematopus]